MLQITQLKTLYAFLQLCLASVLLLTLVTNANADSINTKRSFRITVHPSSYDLKKPDIAIQQKLNAMGSQQHLAKDTQQLTLAYQQRYQVWTYANKILLGIENGSINSQNLGHYSTLEFNRSIQSDRNRMQMLLEKFKSFGNKLELTLKENKSVVSDNMLIEKQLGQDTVRIQINHFLNPPTYKEVKASKPYYYLSLTFKATAPYKNWRLSGMHISAAQFTPY